MHNLLVHPHATYRPKSTEGNRMMERRNGTVGASDLDLIDTKREFDSLFKIIGDQFKSLDIALQDRAMEFLEDAYQVHRMFESFRRNGTVKGVCKELKLHRNTIRWRLGQLGLTTDDFKNAQNSMQLIKRSPLLQQQGASLFRTIEENVEARSSTPSEHVA